MSTYDNDPRVTGISLTEWAVDTADGTYTVWSYSNGTDLFGVLDGDGHPVPEWNNWGFDQTVWGLIGPPR